MVLTRPLRVKALIGRRSLAFGVDLLSLLAVLAGTLSSANAAPLTDTRIAAASTRPLVLLVRPAGLDRQADEVATRILAELMANDVPVFAVRCATPGAACEPVEFAAARIRATILVSRRDDILAVEVRAGDSERVVSLPLPGGARPAAYRTLPISYLTLEGQDSASVAVRTVEVVRALSMDDDPGNESPSEAPHADPVHVVQVADSLRASPPVVAVPDVDLVANDRAHPTTFEVGVGALRSFDRLGNGFAPVLRLRHVAKEHLEIWVSAMGPTVGRDLSNASGTVALRQELLEVGASLVGHLREPFWVRMGLGLGIYHLHVEGSPSIVSQTRGAGPHEDGRFSGMMSWSVAAGANLRGRLSVFVDGRLFVLSPAPSVTLLTEEIGRSGNPGAIMTVGVGIGI